MKAKDLLKLTEKDLTDLVYYYSGDGYYGEVRERIMKTIMRRLRKFLEQK